MAGLACGAPVYMMRRMGATKMGDRFLLCPPRSTNVMCQIFWDKWTLR
jgi:hypothetical protein